MSRRQLLAAGWNTRVIDEAIARADLLDRRAPRPPAPRRACGTDAGSGSPLTQQGDAPRMDFLRPDSKLVVEVDGWAADRTRVAFQRDGSTTNGLQLDGYTDLRFAWEDLTRRPAMVADQIRKALRR